MKSESDLAATDVLAKHLQMITPYYPYSSYSCGVRDGDAGRFGDGNAAVDSDVGLLSIEHSL